MSIRITQIYRNGNGDIDREDGPATVWSNGDEFWHRNGKLHRTDGPAVKFADGHQEWWLNGVAYDPLDWLLKLHELQEAQ